MPSPTLATHQSIVTPAANAMAIGKEIKALYPEYDKYSDEIVGEQYIAKYGNTPVSRVQQKNQLLMIQTNCNSQMSGYTSCTSDSFNTH